MPTPVATARQCLTDEAARALDEAVSVARRRNHAQTTSLHVVSAFLSSPSSLLREACSRARSSAYASRIQFRALELSVGVSLDRLQCSKNQSDDAPPISNSLMAAIKRSQANQRRQPEMYHLTQIQIQNGNPMSMSSIKVELKQFVLSILDDPIVSRVFGEAGFRSCDIKLAIIHPPISPPARYLRSRCPPVFLCNLTDNGFPVSGNIPFPFASAGGLAGIGDSNGDEYCKRIGEVLVKNSGRNPLLVGVCAKEALVSFREFLKKGKEGGGRQLSLLPNELAGLNFFCMEKEIKDCVANGGGGEAPKEAVDLKIKELCFMVENDSEGPGVVVNFGELKVLVDDSVSMVDAVKGLVLKLSSLVELHRKKLWLIGAAEDYETYSKFVERFPLIERDWDLHPLPITSSRSSVEGLYSKSSLMGSFVPFAGFFPAPSEFRHPLSFMNRPFARCSMCNEKYEREVSATLYGGSSVSIAEHCSASLPSWLMAESNLNKAGNAVEQAKDNKAASTAKVLVLQKKWDDICQRLHQSPTISRPEIPLTQPVVPHSPGIQFVADKQGRSSGDLYLNRRVCSDLTSCSPVMTAKVSSHNEDRTISPASLAGSADSQLKLASERSKSLPHEMDGLALPNSPLCDLTLPHDYTSGSSLSSVTTDLGLGTYHPSRGQQLQQYDFLDCRESWQHPSDSTSVARGTIREKPADQVVQSSSSNGPDLREQLDLACYKPLWRELTEKAGWQDEVICSISQIISSCRSGYGRPRAPKSRGDIWITFLGPDKIGKRRVAETVADVVCGSKDNLIAVDFCCQESASKSNSMFRSRGLDNFDEISRKTMVGYIAEELSKKPCSVVFLENIEEADLVMQSSLSHAIQTGKFPGSHGREISITNMIFVTTSSTTKDEKNPACRKELVRFSERSILEAKNWQMQIVVGCIKGDVSGSNSLIGSLSSKEDAIPVNKRKLSEARDPTGDSSAKRNKMPKNCFDLNLPLEESEATDTENSDNTSISDNSRAWLEDFLEQVDGKVVFKPFDFDALANQLMKKTSLEFEKKTRSRVRLEIDHEVMVQILAAAWSSYKKGVTERWIEQVLGASFAEAQQRFSLTAHSVVRLVACEGLPVREEAPCICLPSRVNLT